MVRIFLPFTMDNVGSHLEVFLSGCAEVENCTSQIAKPRNFAHPYNTTLLHEFYLTAPRILEYTPTQCLPAPLPHGLMMERGFS